MPRGGRRAALVCGAVVVAAVAAVYWRGLSGGFVFDDLDAIPGNPSIRHLATALAPPTGTTVSGRPVLNLSLALNFLVSGTRPWSYHALNIVIHAAAALILFGIVGRTLAIAPEAASTPGKRLAVAFAAALLWALHPLQTESVAYVVQRAESLAGLFYLATLFAVLRIAQSGRTGWAAAAVAACLLGMGTKETMVTAPLVVLVFDRTFLASSFREAWRRRGGLYLALAACWLPLAFLVLSTGGRGGTAGYGAGVPWWEYLLAQFRAIGHYLRLAVWPAPLVGDYGRVLAPDPLGMAVGALVVLALVAGTLILARKRRPAAFLGAWFLLVLAPSSSIVPVSTEIIAEHRMYLPLASVVLAVVLGLDRWLGRRRALFGAAIGLLALSAGIASARRVGVYGSPFAFWSDVVLKNPGNAGAWNNLGLVLAGQGDLRGASEDYRRALALAPAFADAHANLGVALAATGNPAEAAENIRAALRYRPEDASLHLNLGRALAALGRRMDAVGELREATRLDPGRSASWYALGGALADTGDLPGASPAYAEAVRLRPDFADARVDYGNVLAELGKAPEAERQFSEALRLQPNAADVHNNLGSLLAGMGRMAEAKAQFEEALRLKPDYPDARQNLERLQALQPEPGR